MTGLELCEKIVDMNPEQYIVIISGYNEFEFAQEAISYGVKGYLLKPITTEKLEAVLNKAQRHFESINKSPVNSVAMPDPIWENELIVKAKEYIWNNYKKPISLVEVAQELSVSANYLSTLFRQELGQSYINYLTTLRMEKAVEDINAHPRKKIYEVVEAVGYVSVKHFIHVFKKRARNLTGRIPETGFRFKIECQSITPC